MAVDNDKFLLWIAERIAQEQANLVWDDGYQEGAGTKAISVYDYVASKYKHLAYGFVDPDGNRPKQVSAPTETEVKPL